VRKDGAQVLICTLIARDYDKNIVGQIDDEIAAGLASIEKFTTIPTRSQAVNADVIACRVK